MKLFRFFASTPHGVLHASAPAGEGYVTEEAATILDMALDIGAEILHCGGEIHRVEDTITRICYAYGASEVHVFAITSLITAEVQLPDGTYATRTRRVGGSYNHLSRLEACNALSRAICAAPVSAAEVKKRLAAIRSYRPVPEWLCYLGGTLATGAFAVFFGGTIPDGLAAATIGLLLTLFARLRPVRINGMLKSLISSLAAGILSVLCVMIGFGTNVDKIIIGTIMLEIPGLSFGNALRDLLCGETLAGTLRTIQAILQTLMIALGYMVALALFNQLGGVV